VRFARQTKQSTQTYKKVKYQKKIEQVLTALRTVGVFGVFLVSVFRVEVHVPWDSHQWEKGENYTLHTTHYTPQYKHADSTASSWIKQIQTKNKKK